MAESELTLLHEDISDEISEKFFGTLDHEDLTDDQQTKLDNIIKLGYMQFLYPPAAGDIEAGYEWSFMKPWTTLDLIAVYKTGTVAVVTNTCTLTTGTWPEWAATNGILTIGGTRVTIVTRDSGSELALLDADDVTAGEEDWTIAHDGDYPLPDDFGRLIDGYYFSLNDQDRYILGGVDAGRIKNFRAQGDTTGEPRIAAEVILPTDGKTSQRREAWFCPRSTSAETLHYKYEAFIGIFEDGEYPAGSLKFSDTLLESCLALAETRIDDERGIHWEMFVEKMVSSIARDKKQNSPIVGNVGRANKRLVAMDVNYKLQIGDTVIQS